MTFTATHIAYYHLCHRKLWLLSQGIRLENSTGNAYVEEGKLISETSYFRRPQKWRELALEGIKIDHFDPQTNMVREVKKSPKLEKAHVAQVQYYLYRLEESGISNPTGIIEYPKQKRSRQVVLDDRIKSEVRNWLAEIQRITALPNCPEVINKPYCARCAFRDFCYI